MNPAPANFSFPSLSAPRRLACAETWAGNKRTAGLIELPGLTAWVHSLPAGVGRAGGDVHYLSVCPGCVISRIALGDVSGHGQAVATFGRKLRELMQVHLREAEQMGLMRDLNQAVRSELGMGHYASMVAVGWHGRQDRMIMTNAGHPAPILYQSQRHEWSSLHTIGEASQPADIPLGLLPDVAYKEVTVPLQLDDLVVLYSDGVTEATDANGAELGFDGLLRLAQGLDHRSAESFGSELVSALHAFRGATDRLDDETLIVIQRNIREGELV